MNQDKLRSLLHALPLGEVRYFDRIGSTNDEAANWVKEDCPDLALVVANEQTAGRGRSGRKWFTPAGSALAFSLVLRTKEHINQLLKFQNTARINGLGALAVSQTLQRKYTLPAEIKWPNDIIVSGKKLSGVLAEAHWIGSELIAVVLGIGINVEKPSVPPDNWDTLNPHSFPATSLETALGAPVKRWELLYDVLQELLSWRDQLSAPTFIKAWQANLAFQGQWVQLFHPGINDEIQVGKIRALADDGALQMKTESGEVIWLRSGEIHPLTKPKEKIRLRPVDSSEK